MTLGAESQRAAGGAVLGLAACDALTPHLERRAFHRLAHQLDHLLFGDAELVFDRLKGGAVLPGHLDDAIELLWIERAHQLLGLRAGR